MQIDGGPPDGDYVAYIDRLVNQNQAAPGSIIRTKRRKSRKPKLGVRQITPLDPAPTTPEEPTLAAQGDKRTSGVIQLVMGAGVVLIMINVALSFLFDDDGLHPGQLIPIVVLIFIASQLFRHGWAKLRPRPQPAADASPFPPQRPPLP